MYLCKLSIEGKYLEIIMVKASSIKGIISAFNKQPLNSKEYLDKFYVDTIENRVGNNPSPIDILYEFCTEFYNEPAYLLMGHRGCGKSTELNNLKCRLFSEGFPIKLIDCNLEMDLRNVNHFDILYYIFLNLLDIVEENNISIDNQWLLDALNYFKSDNENIITTQDIVNDEFNIGVGLPDFLKKIFPLFASIKSDMKYNSTNTTVVRNKIELQTSKCLDLINFLKDKIFEETHKSPIIIFEDLDKIVPATRAIDVFSYYVLGEMQFPVIYTFPISLSYKGEFNNLKGKYSHKNLPMIKVNNKDNSVCESGINAIKEIVYKRADKNLFDEPALKQLILKTGGDIRDAFECIINAARLARKRNSDVIEEQDVRTSLILLKSDMKKMLVTSMYNDLLNIHNSKEEIENREKMLEFLQSHFVLEYNGDGWCDVHPLILDFIIEHKNE